MPAVQVSLGVETGFWNQSTWSTDIWQRPKRRGGKKPLMGLLVIVDWFDPPWLGMVRKICRWRFTYSHPWGVRFWLKVWWPGDGNRWLKKRDKRGVSNLCTEMKDSRTRFDKSWGWSSQAGSSKLGCRSQSSQPEMLHRTTLRRHTWWGSKVETGNQTSVHPQL